METVVPQQICPATGKPFAGTSFPLSAYTIDYDEGGFTAVSRKAVGTLTEMTFATVRWVVSVGTWLISWAFSFGFADRLAQPMAAVAGRYQTAFYVPLVGGALLLSAAYGAVQVFRGRTGRGVAEFAASLVLVAGIGTWLLADPASFLGGALNVTAQVAGAVATVGLGSGTPACPATPGSFANPQMDAAVAPLTGEIERSFVRQPYELLEWGTLVPPGCAQARDAVLASGAGGDRDALVTVMDQPGCTALYRFNREPSTERLGVAVLVLFAASLLMISLGMVAGTVVAAQIVAVLLIALLPFAALAAALPGAGRTATWRWAAAMIRSLTTIVVMSGFLTFLLLTSDALLHAEQGQSLLAQMAVLNVVAVLGFGLRRRAVRAGRLAATHLSRRFEAVQPGLRAPRTAIDVLSFTAPAARGGNLLVAADLGGRVATAVDNARGDA